MSVDYNMRSVSASVSVGGEPCGGHFVFFVSVYTVFTTLCLPLFSVSVPVYQLLMVPRGLDPSGLGEPSIAAKTGQAVCLLRQPQRRRISLVFWVEPDLVRRWLFPGPRKRVGDGRRGVPRSSIRDTHAVGLTRRLHGAVQRRTAGPPHAAQAAARLLGLEGLD